MKGLLYYYYKSTEKQLWGLLLQTIFMNIVFVIVTAVDTKGPDKSPYTALFYVAPVLIFFIALNSVTGGFTLNENKEIKSILSAPVSQKKLFLAKYIYVGIVSIALLVVTILLEFLYSGFVKGTAIEIVKIVASIFGCRLFLNAMEVPLYHLFDKKTVFKIMFIIFLSIACLIVIFVMFANLDGLFDVLKDIQIFFKNKNILLILNFGGVAIYGFSYLIFSNFKKEFD